MRLVAQKTRLPVTPVDDESSRQGVFRRHGPLFPTTIRCIICGPSNAGKTNLMIRLLEDPNGLRFENVYVYSRSLHQPKYQRLARVLQRVKGVGYFPYRDSEGIVATKDAKKNSVFIFDDIACDKQDVMREYFCMGRHNNIDAFYLCQSYARIPKQLVRDNTNLLAIFKQDATNLRHIYDDHVIADCSFQEFLDMANLAWGDKYSFLAIDKDSPRDDGRYRKNFDMFIKRN